MTRRDERFMRRALELAAKAEWRAAPNPRVGALVVRGGRVVGEGHHRQFGGPHAEVLALKAAGRRAKGATLYVTLEPCSPHPKKTPPCAEAVARSGVARVVAAGRDPNPNVRGRGLALLRRAGIHVTSGVLAKEARALNEPFFKAHLRGLPYVVCKWAMTLDGRIATRTGDSRWISSARSRAWARKFRDSFQAIVVGIGTVLRDDPMLRGRQTRPARIILDTRARTPVRSRLARTARGQWTVVVVSPSAPKRNVRRLEQAGIEILPIGTRDVRRVFRALARGGLHRVLVEGGGQVHASVLKAGLADEACVFVAPKIIGGKGAPSPVEGKGLARMAQALPVQEGSVERMGSDVVIRGRIRS